MKKEFIVLHQMHIKSLMTIANGCSAEDFRYAVTQILQSAVDDEYVVPNGETEAERMTKAISILISDYSDKEYAKIKKRFDRAEPKYREWRKAVLERDDYRCRICGSQERLHAHHIKPYVDYPDLRFDVDNGITLCKDCHWGEHRK